MEEAGCWWIEINYDAFCHMIKKAYAPWVLFWAFKRTECEKKKQKLLINNTNIDLIELEVEKLWWLLVDDLEDSLWLQWGGRDVYRFSWDESVVLGLVSSVAWENS